MSTETTPTRWSQRLQQICDQLDKVLDSNPSAKKLPPLHDYDYDFYLKSVVNYNRLFAGKIMYKGREIKRMGEV